MALPSRNLSSIDRMARGFIGITVCAFLFLGNYIEDPIIQWLLLIFGILNLVSLFTAWCPIYHIASLSTYKKNDE